MTTIISDDLVLTVCTALRHYTNNHPRARPRATDLADDLFQRWNAGDRQIIVSDADRNLIVEALIFSLSHRPDPAFRRALDAITP